MILFILNNGGFSVNVEINEAGMDCQPKRQKSCDQLRIIARRLHERAVKCEYLADHIANAPNRIDEAMLEILRRNRLDY